MPQPPDGEHHAKVKIGMTNINLFVSRMLRQLPFYIAYKVYMVHMVYRCIATSMDRKFSYVFPSFSLISLVLKKLKIEKVKTILIIPTWQEKAWYFLILNITIKKPYLRPHHTDLLLDPFRKAHTLILSQKLSLAA